MYAILPKSTFLIQYLPFFSIMFTFSLWTKPISWSLTLFLSLSFSVFLCLSLFMCFLLLFLSLFLAQFLLNLFHLFSCLTPVSITPNLYLEECGCCNRKKDASSTDYLIISSLHLLSITGINCWISIRLRNIFKIFVNMFMFIIQFDRL